MRPNRRNRPQGCLNTLALALASLTVPLMLWACLGLALAPAPSPPDPACPYEPDTDSYVEWCVLGPWFDDASQDGIDATINQEGND